ncbi:hypothetical protein [Nocardioides yefusunii]|uniref:Uncharacterized protein n=1 Tax=Nocardioides yefusunii TaxID=2500546 RepID=A0ABW1R0E1_9ACTN|nr:hypothetical protein [Nocardioides yefusunii]
MLTPDLFDPEFGVAGEYDGVVHDSLSVRRRDLDREERARQAGIEVVSMNSTDLVDRTSFDRRLSNAYTRAQRRQQLRDQRSWQVEPHRFES